MEILVVDDDEQLRFLLHAALSYEGFLVREAANGKEALIRLRERKPDVILLDFMMPEMSGEDVCKFVKQDADFSDVIVFILSASSDIQTKLRFFENGADDFLVKPVDPLEITSRIERFLKLKRPHDAVPAIPQKKEFTLSQSPVVIVKERYGPYKVEGLVGHGGMGQVFKGIDALLERPVAIKVLAKQLADSEFVERFRREARLLASIDHPGIASIYAFGQEEDEHYFAMQWCSGGSLTELIHEKTKIDPGIASDYVLQCAVSLAAASRKGIVHRDIKPSNLMFDDEGRVKLVDFGIAFSSKASVHLTATSFILGTPLYMSPEQSKGQEVDQRSDIYSLGITFYHMILGKPPFTGTNPVEIIIKQTSEPLPAFQDESTIPWATYQVIKKMTEKSPADRYQDYESLIDELLQVQGKLSGRKNPEHPTGVLHFTPSQNGIAIEKKDRIGSYILEAEVGGDSISKVFKAYDEAMSRCAEVRVFSRECCRSPGFPDQLEQRIRTLGTLNHQGIGSTYHFGRDGLEYFVAREWSSGGSLTDLVRKKGRLRLGLAQPLILQCVEALSSAHQVGVFHGSLRPDHVLLDENQKIKIVDFPWSYMHASSGSTEIRDDIHSLGVIFYYMLYGIVPFAEGDGSQQFLPPFDDLEGNLPLMVHTILQKMTHPNPQSRYGDYASLVKDLIQLESITPHEVVPTIPRPENVSEVPAFSVSNFFDALCGLYAQASSGILLLQWSVVETRLLIRRREIVSFDSNQPAKNIWQFMVANHCLQKEELPHANQNPEKALLLFLQNGTFSTREFIRHYHQLMKQVVEEVFIWPVCEAKFFPATIENRSVASLRISDVLLQASRSSIDYNTITKEIPVKTLLRRTSQFEQLLSSFNLSRQESFLAYRIEGEDTSLESLKILTGLSEETVFRFVYLLKKVGAVEFHSRLITERKAGTHRIGSVRPPEPVTANVVPPPAVQLDISKASVVRMDVMKSEREQQLDGKEKAAEEMFRTAQKQYARGDYWETAHSCMQAIESHPDARYYWLMALAYSHHLRFQKKAEDAYHQAIELDPYNPDYHAGLAEFYVKIKLYLRARNHCEDALRIIPDHRKALEVSASLQKHKLGEGGCWCRDKQ